MVQKQCIFSKTEGENGNFVRILSISLAKRYAVADFSVHLQSKQNSFRKRK